MPSTNKYPSWKYRYFRLRYVDHFGWDDWTWGITLVRVGDPDSKGLRHPQLGISFGHREAIFDLPMWVAKVLPKPPPDW